MENILYNISQVLGITIIHSLWQGLLVYIILRIVISATPSIPALKKYSFAVISMLSISIWFFYTLLTEINTYTWISLKSLNFSRLLPHLNQLANIHIQTPYYNSIANTLPYVCILYFIGLAANLLKLGWEWNKVQQVKRSLIPAEQMQQFINTFSKKLNINKPIKLEFSELVDVPCMVGYLKPLIILPVSLATHLSACEIEAILLHELAHIKRNDYLVNLMQRVISVMLFFNPFAQLVNRIINREREHSCDDLVVEKTGKPLIYVKALLKLEETRGVRLQLALGATGKRFHLLNRIERIMKTKKQIGSISHLSLMILLLAGSISCIAWLSPKTADVKIKTDKVKSALLLKKTARESKINNIFTFQNINKDSLVSDTAKHKHKGNLIIIDKNGVRKEYDSIDELSPAARTAFFKQHPDLKLLLDSLKQFSRPEWKAQMQAMNKQAEEMKKQFDSPEWKAQIETMTKQAEEIKKQFDKPEWKAQMEAMKKQGEEMKKQFDSPGWTAQMEAMNKQAEEMKKQFASPEWKKSMREQKWILKDSIKGIEIYTPEKKKN